MRKYCSGNYVSPSPKSSEDQKKRSSPQLGTKFDRNLWDLFGLPGPFSSVQPALTPRWGDAESRWGYASPLQFKFWLYHPLGNPHMDFQKINSYYLTCFGRSIGLLLSKLPSSDMLCIKFIKVLDKGLRLQLLVQKL